MKSIALPHCFTASTSTIAMGETAIEASSHKVKRPCKYGAKCRRKSCKFAHPPSAGEIAANEKQRAHDKNKCDEDDSSSIDEEKDIRIIHLPLEISSLLDNFVATNESTIKAIASNATIISKLQGENALLMNVAQGTRRDLNHLQEQIVNHLEQQQRENGNKELAVAVETAVAKHKNNAELLIAQEREKTLRLSEELKASKEELKASKHLVSQLLQNHNAAAFGGKQMNSSESGTTHSTSS